jgi:glutaredoxin
MPKVKLLVLPDCTRCKALKSKLEFFNTKFEYVSCDDHPEICDQVEELTGHDSYPMAIVLDINNKITQIVHFTENYDAVSKTTNLVDGATSFTVYSVDQLVEYIIKL